MKTEWKVGEIGQVNGEWYQCLESSNCRCDYCDYGELGDCDNIACMSVERSDSKEIYLEKLEKVGKPFERNGYMYQEYKAHTYPLLMSGDAKISTNNEFAVIIKQTKEDMEKSKLNLKPFNLQKAKEGKPVCTKNGKKARIICFDAKGVLPIIALVESGDEEKTVRYSNSGRFRFDGMPDEEDLIMLSEKKEGWINVYRDCDGVNITKDDNIYSLKDAAIASAQMIYRDNYVATVKIQWEE